MSIYLPSFYKPSKADFDPKRREISAVTNATEAQVTTTEDHGYSVGQLVRLHVPKDYGMVLNGVVGTILTIPGTTDFTVDVDTTSAPSALGILGVNTSDFSLYISTGLTPGGWQRVGQQ